MKKLLFRVVGILVALLAPLIISTSAHASPNAGVHIIRSGIMLPIFAIYSAVAIIYMNFVTPKKK